MANLGIRSRLADRHTSRAHRHTGAHAHRRTPSLQITTTATPTTSNSFYVFISPPLSERKRLSSLKRQDPGARVDRTPDLAMIQKISELYFSRSLSQLSYVSSGGR